MLFGWNCAPFAYSCNSNTVSIELFVSLGFRKHSDVYWIGFTNQETFESCCSSHSGSTCDSAIVNEQSMCHK